MKFARVIGTVVATVKAPSFVGKKLLILQPVDGRGQNLGSPIVGMDSVGAGAGELVLYVGGKEASFPFLPQEVPVDAGIVGIIDTIDRYDFPAAPLRAPENESRLSRALSGAPEQKIPTSLSPSTPPKGSLSKSMAAALREKRRRRRKRSKQRRRKGANR